MRIASPLFLGETTTCSSRAKAAIWLFQSDRMVFQWVLRGRRQPGLTAAKSGTALSETRRRTRMRRAQSGHESGRGADSVHFLKKQKSSTFAAQSAFGHGAPLRAKRANVKPPISSSLTTQMSGPGVTSASIFSFWIDVPVCRPPFGNDTHLPHSGRMHSCPNTLELAINAASTNKPRMHVLLLCPTPEITWPRVLQALSNAFTTPGPDSARETNCQSLDISDRRACRGEKPLATIRARIRRCALRQEVGGIHVFARHCCPCAARNHRV